MDKIEKIRQKIERHRQAIRVLSEHTAPEQTSKTCAIFQYSDTILSELLSFLDTLSEEPDKSLEEAAESHTFFAANQPGQEWETHDVTDAFIAGAEWMAGHFEKERLRDCDELTPEDAQLEDDFVESHFKKNQRTPTFIDAIKYGAEWQKIQMMKEAEETELYWDGDFLAIDLNMAALGYSESDKVRIIIVKEEKQ